MDPALLRSTSAHIFVSPEQLDAEAPIQLDERASHHLARVLRLRNGEQVSVSDGAGRWRIAIVAASADSFVLEPRSEIAVVKRRAEFHLAVAIPKGDRFDWLIQKVTELGVDQIVLLHADRSVVRWKPDRIRKHLKRAQRISDEASRQSRRVTLAAIEGPVDAHTVLSNYAAAEPGGQPPTPSDRFVAIGPEGGWSERELRIALKRIDLGQNILRTETAAVTATALCVVSER